LLSEIEGEVEGHRDGHGFVRAEDGITSVMLSAQEMASVLHRDRVRARITRFDKRGRPEGKVLEILDRRKSPIIGRLLLEGGLLLVAPEDKRFGQDIIIAKNGMANAVAGQVVAVELTEPPSLYAKPVGRVVEVLGEVDDPGMEIEIAVRKFEVPHRFSPQTLAEAAALPDRLRAADKKGRVDLTDVHLVTIDGEDARDFDDAVYCEPFKRGRGKTAFEGWRLLVAIADVSHYVKPGEALDGDAYERATSVYFPRRVIPMLPEKLSNGLCSLNPQVERLCMVCDMLVDLEGDVQAYQFYPAVMCSQARLTYTQVAAWLGNTPAATDGQAALLLPHLLNLHDVYRALLKQRTRRGAVDFETSETQIVCDDKGRILRIVARTRNEAHRLIEEAMLAANVCAADFIASSDHAGLFRVHEGPTPERRTTLQAYLRALGIGLHLSDDPTPGEIQAIAAATKDRVDAQQIHTMLLRSMQQAVYTSERGGHFGLAYAAYTHFTSPIRRYPDLLVHRVIKALLTHRIYNVDADLVARTPSAPRKVGKGKPAAAKKLTPELQTWELAGQHCSANERRADEASRDVEAWLKCRYMREHLGEEFNGTVSAATSFGLFITLDELFVEGLLHITELGGEYYRFDEIHQELRGERTGMRFAIGTKLRVQVSRVDLDGRRVEFRMVKDALSVPTSAAKPRQDAGARRNVQEELLAVQEVDRSKKKAARLATAKATAGKRIAKPVESGPPRRAGKGGGAGKKAARAGRTR
jgi:ribonuclease R